MDGTNSTEKGRGLRKLAAASISSLSPTCGISSRHVSDAVVPPIFVSSRHHHSGKLQPNHTRILPPTPPPLVSLGCRSCRPSATAAGRRPTPGPVIKKKKWRLLSNGYGFSSCSSGDEESFSSEDGDGGKRLKGETETLLSSRSFSSDSSEFYNTSAKNRKKQKKKKDKVMRQDQCGRSKVGTAVVKQTSDPYGDFRTSVMEMVVENQIAGSKDLERLLRSYLALNSPSHHPIILQVFDDVWTTLFNS